MTQEQKTEAVISTNATLDQQWMRIGGLEDHARDLARKLDAVKAIWAPDSKALGSTWLWSISEHRLSETISEIIDEIMEGE